MLSKLDIKAEEHTTHRVSDSPDLNSTVALRYKLQQFRERLCPKLQTLIQYSQLNIWIDMY